MHATLEEKLKADSITPGLQDHPVVSAIMRNTSKSPHGRRYNDHDMLLGIGALNIGKKCHTFINNNIMPLPSPSTIQGLANSIFEKVRVIIGI